MTASTMHQIPLPKAILKKGWNKTAAAPKTTVSQMLRSANFWQARMQKTIIAK
jgi:hypothetical protein